MSFGVGIGDLVTIGQLALDVYNRCRQSAGQYRDLSSDVGQLALVLSNLEDLAKRNRLAAVQKSQLWEHGQACKTVLTDIEEVLEKYSSLSSKSKKIQDMLGWKYEDAQALRDRLTACVVMLSAFYDDLTTSSIFRLEDAMNCLLRQIRTGETSADAMSILTTTSIQSVESPQAWRFVIQDLEDLGISASDANKNRAFIVHWFAQAFEAANEAENDSLKKVECQVTEIAVQPEFKDRGGGLRSTIGWIKRKLDFTRQIKEQDEQESPAYPLTDDLSVETFSSRPASSPLHPVFAVPLQALYQRDGSLCPVAVRTCVGLVDSFRLDVEGIYSTAESASTVLMLQQKIDADSRNLKGHIAAACGQDPRLAAALLKHFLATLPEPILKCLPRLPNRHDSGPCVALFLIQNLPLPQYATLRIVALHLARVSQHSARNQETPIKLAWTFAPILFADSLENPYARARFLEHIIIDAGYVFPWDEEEAQNKLETEPYSIEDIY